MDNRQAQRLPRDIQSCFGFLYDRGYCVRQVEHAEWLTGNWTVIFESRIMLVYVYNNDGRIGVDLSGNNPAVSNRRVPVERLINTLSDGRDLVMPFRGSIGASKKKQLERLSLLLREHIDQLTSYFANLS